MALDKQIHLYSIDTSRFYNDKENEISKKKMKSTYIVNGLKEKRKKNIDKVLFYDKWIKIFNSVKNEYSTKLLEEVQTQSKYNIKNKIPRELKYRNTNKDNFLVSEFTSSVTRSFGIKEDEITEDIIIVRVYYVDLFEDLLHNGFIYNGKKYIYYSSSAGQIRTKKAVFVNEEQWNKNRNRLMCGLTEEIINSKGGCNTNKFLAYTSLSNSATDLWKDIFKTEFDINRCIVVDDFETMVNTTYDHVSSADFSVNRIQQDSLIPHMDGCGLISSRISNKNFM